MYYVYTMASHCVPHEALKKKKTFFFFIFKVYQISNQRVYDIGKKK